jgi:trimeric autotransporter adhesin
MKHRIAGLVLGFLLLALSLVPLTPAQTPTQATSALPRLVRFNGTAKDLNGNPLAGVVGVTFSLYSEQTGGAPLWLETQNMTADNNGRYTVLLGSTKPDGLPPELFTSEQAHWVGVQISGQEEQPRVLLVSAPYALKAGDAETVGGLPPSAFALAAGAPAAKTTSATPTPSSSSTASSGPLTTSNVTTTGGKVHALPMFTTATNIQNSIVTESTATSIDVAGKVGINTAAPTQSLDVTSGNAIVRGVGNFSAKGDTATLYVGDTSHPIQALFDSGLAIGTFKAPEAIFIADFTGNVGIGTTTPTTGILNTAANTKSVIGLSTVGWSAASGSSLSGTDALHATGGNGDPDNSENGGTGAVVNGGSGVEGSGGAGAIITGGTGSSFGSGGVGLRVTGGLDNDDFAGGDAIVATGGDFGGIGLVASSGGGEAFDNGVPGIMTTGGVGGGSAIDGPGILAAGQNEPGGIDGAGDGIDAIAGVGTGSANGNAGSFTGDVSISGNLNVSGTKSFKIDHPLDPANKYLYHAALESSEVLNLYSGNATLDASGEATVQLPDWFQALNRDFRYQLTAIGGAAPNLHIAQKIENNSFKVAGGSVGLEVSWQVTGVRQDAWEKAHPMVVEVQKPKRERGYYINPELYGAPPERNMDWARNPQVMKRLRSLQQKQVAQHQAAQKQARLAQPMKSTKP